MIKTRNFYNSTFSLQLFSIKFAFLHFQVAAKAGYAALKSGKSAEEAAVAAVVSMENDPIFNCGYGASLTRNGTVELDAMLMRSKDYQIGEFFRRDLLFEVVKTLIFITVICENLAPRCSYGFSV